MSDATPPRGPDLSSLSVSTATSVASRVANTTAPVSVRPYPSPSPSPPKAHVSVSASPPRLEVVSVPARPVAVSRAMAGRPDRAASRAVDGVLQDYVAVLQQKDDALFAIAAERDEVRTRLDALGAESRSVAAELRYLRAEAERTEHRADELEAALAEQRGLRQEADGALSSAHHQLRALFPDSHAPDSLSVAVEATCSAVTRLRAAAHSSRSGLHVLVPAEEHRSRCDVEAAHAAELRLMRQCFLSAGRAAQEAARADAAEAAISAVARAHLGVGGIMSVGESCRLLDARLVAAAVQRDSLTAELAAVRAECSEWRAASDAASRAAAHLQALHSGTVAMDHQRKAAVLEAERYRRELRAMRAELERTASALAEQRQHRHEASTAAATARTALSKLRRDQADATAAAGAAQDAAAATERHLRAAAEASVGRSQRALREVAGLRARLEDATTAATAADKRCTALQSELTAAQSAAAKAADALTREKARRTEAEAAAAEAAITTEAEAARRSSAETAAAKAHGEYEARITALTERLASTQAAHTTAAAKAAEELATKEAALLVQQQRAAALQAALEDKDAACLVLEGELRKARAAACTECPALRARYAALQDEHRDLEEVCRRSVRTVHALRGAVRAEADALHVQ